MRSIWRRLEQDPWVWTWSWGQTWCSPSHRFSDDIHDDKTDAIVFRSWTNIGESWQKHPSRRSQSKATQPTTGSWQRINGSQGSPNLSWWRTGTKDWWWQHSPGTRMEERWSWAKWRKKIRCLLAITYFEASLHTFQKFCLDSVTIYQVDTEDEDILNVITTIDNVVAKRRFRRHLNISANLVAAGRRHSVCWDVFIMIRYSNLMVITLKMPKYLR